MSWISRIFLRKSLGKFVTCQINNNIRFAIKTYFYFDQIWSSFLCFFIWSQSGDAENTYWKYNKKMENSDTKKTLTCLYHLFYENWQIGNVPFSYIKSIFFNSIQKYEIHQRVSRNSIFFQLYDLYRTIKAY